MTVKSDIKCNIQETLSFEFGCSALVQIGACVGPIFTVFVKSRNTALYLSILLFTTNIFANVTTVDR